MLAAIAHPPHLAGICPVVTASNYHENWTYQGGAFEQFFNESLTSGLAQDTLSRWVGRHTNVLNGIKYFLHSAGKANSMRGNGTLSTTAPGKETADHYIYDPANPSPTIGGPLCCDGFHGPPGPKEQRPVEARDDVLIYSTVPMSEDTEVTGPISLELYAKSSAVDTDFEAKLVDVWPDGFAQNLTDGIIRARYRDSREKPELMNPGQVYTFSIDMWATSNVFKKGHVLRLEVSSSNFPRFDRNLNTGATRYLRSTDSGSQFVSATDLVLHDTDHPSVLVLPINASEIAERAEFWFFRPFGAWIISPSHPRLTPLRQAQGKLWATAMFPIRRSGTVCCTSIRGAPDREGSSCREAEEAGGGPEAGQKRTENEAGVELARVKACFLELRPPSNRDLSGMLVDGLSTRLGRVFRKTVGPAMRALWKPLGSKVAGLVNTCPLRNRFSKNGISRKPCNSNFRPLEWMIHRNSLKKVIE
jgi:hypothetical protein